MKKNASRYVITVHDGKTIVTASRPDLARLAQHFGVTPPALMMLEVPGYPDELCEHMRSHGFDAELDIPSAIDGGIPEEFAPLFSPGRAQERAKELQRAREMLKGVRESFPESFFTSNQGTGGTQ